MKLKRNANSVAFSKIFANSVVARVFFWYTLFGVKYAVHGLIDIDTVFKARCEAKCLNRPEDDRIPCISTCLNGSWNKPGECPSNDTDSEPNLEKELIKFCKNDIECSGMLKCCQHASNSTCQASTHLENYTGWTAIPTGLVATILRNPQEDEKAKILLRWTPVKTTNVDERVVYIIEECHHHGKTYFPERLTKWIDWKRTSRSSVEYKNIGEPGRWFRFRVSSVNENGTLGPSTPTNAIYASSLPRVPRAPQGLKVTATSFGNGRLHLLLTWTKPSSEAPIDKYKVTWSILKNYTLSGHHYTIPAILTNFWLHNLEPQTKYFLDVRAQATFGKKKLIGRQASIVFQTADQNHADHSKHEEEKELIVKHRRHIRNLVVEKIFWLHDQLLALISWKPLKNAPTQTNYSVSWSHDNCQGANKAHYFVKTAMINIEIYDLKPECQYKVSVKAILGQTLYVEHKSFSTNGCKKNDSILHNLITDCL